MELVEYRPAIDRPLAPLCSVCIAHYRGPELLATCIDSLLEQDCNFEFEIIGHDDASNDGSLEFLSRGYPQVEVLASAENVGFSIANNRMVAQARGLYVLLLNNDAALFADALSTFAQASIETPLAILTLPQYDWESGTLVYRGCLLDPFYNPVPNLDPTLPEVGMVR
jgi:GT2 family glycosyltransferase